MNTVLAAIALVCGLIVGGTTHAQGPRQPWDTIITLTAEDRAIVRNTVLQQIHGKPPGTVARWSNPDSGNSGMIKLLNKLTSRGMPCEKIEYTIMEPSAVQKHGQLWKH